MQYRWLVPESRPPILAPCRPHVTLVVEFPTPGFTAVSFLSLTLISKRMFREIDKGRTAVGHNLHMNVKEHESSHRRILFVPSNLSVDKLPAYSSLEHIEPLLPNT